MATLDPWINEALPELPGATKEGLKQVIRRVFRDFCVESGAFILEQETPISVVAGQPKYDVRDAFPTLLTGSFYEPIYIWSVGFFPNYAVDPHNVSFLSSLQAPNYRNRATMPSNRPLGYKTFIDQPGIFELVPVVDINIADAMSCYVAFRPSTTVDWDAEVPDVFEFNWFDILLNGILGVMLDQQDKPYSNPMKARICQQRFILGKARAREMARRQFNSGDAAHSFPRESGWIS